MNTKDRIKQKCKEIEDLLIDKNKKYGDSALNPLNAGLVEDTEDTLIDIAGYIILLMISKEDEGNNIQRRKAYKGSSSHTAGDCTIAYSGGEEQGSDS